MTVTASEPAEGKYAFDVPAEIQGGAIQVTFNNTGKEGHELGFVKRGPRARRHSSSPTTC